MAGKSYKPELSRKILDLVKYASRWRHKIELSATNEDMAALDALLESAQVALVHFPKPTPLPNAE